MIAVPTDDKVKVSPVFGRAQFLALFKDKTTAPEFIEGAAAQTHGAGTGMVNVLLEHKVTEVYAAEIGPKAYDALIAADIATTIVKAGTALAELWN